MYKLGYFRAVNLIGFASGLGKREFVIDLRNDGKGKLYNKDVIIILGDNATGKSTFLSLIHPMHTPADDRQKFVIPGKEGLLVREYDGEDGTIIRTKCVYKPKDEGHTPKCFFEIVRLGEEPQELNPNGNVSSYNDLLYTHFGINKDFVNFASYSDAVDHIVKLNGTERKNSVSSLIPNTGRFEIAFNTVNEKWKGIRNMMRNVSQKILQIRDEDTLERQLEEVSEALTDAEHSRDEYLQKLAKAEGRVKELSHDADMKTMVELRNKLQFEYMRDNNEYQKIENELNQAADDLDISREELEVQATKELQKALRKWNSLSAKHESAVERAKKLTIEIDRNRSDLNDAKAALFSIDTYDIEQLKRDKQELEKTLNKLQYTHHKDLYEGMTYDEVVSFSKTLAVIDRMIQSLYEEYGDLVSQYFRGFGLSTTDKSSDMEKLSVELMTNSARKDEIYRQLVEKEQYKSLQDTLAKRPISCKIDTCPFIVEALKWEKISGEIQQLRAEYEQIEVTLGHTKDRIKDLEKKAELYSAAQNVVDYIESQRSLLRKYLYIDPEKVYKSIGNGTWMQVLDINKLKSVAAVLSEKDLYIRITTQQLPEIDKALSVATAYGTSRVMLESQISRIDSTLELLIDEKSMIELTSGMDKKMVDHYKKSIDVWERIKNRCELSRQKLNDLAKQESDLKQLVHEITVISELVEKCKRYDALLHDAEDQIDALTPKKQQLLMDMKTLVSLKLEKEQLEQNFIIVEVMKMIIQPGKGIRKELINIYMYDIFQLANQLLLDTFDGKLYLKEFIISDKEFIIPFVANGVEIVDISYASSSQQSTISIALSLAIISKLIDKYGVMCIDEADRTLSLENKMIFAEILVKRMKILGIKQCFAISHSPEVYEANTDSMGILAFPGSKFNRKENDYIEI